MNSELEALIRALDAWLEDEASARREAIYRSRIEDFLALHPKTDRAALLKFVRCAHARWLRSQKRTSALPPTA